MSGTETRDAVLRAVQNTDKPAVSAADLAEITDLSVPTINEHIDDLVDAGSVESVQIGNATAYYIPENSYDYELSCKRCGREFDDRHDHVVLNLEKSFTKKRAEPGVPNTYILCRFCHSHLVNFLYDGHPHSNDYRRVHTWDIPREMLVDARANSDLTTRPEHKPGDEGQNVIIDYIDHRGSLDSPVEKSELMEFCREASELPELDAGIEKEIDEVVNMGYALRMSAGLEPAYAPAK